MDSFFYRNRTRVAFFLLLAVCLPGMALAAEAAFAPLGPKEAVLYPDEAVLLVEEQRVPQDVAGLGRGVLIALPGPAKQETVQFALNGATVSGWIWLDEDQALALGAPVARRAMLPENEDSAERAALLAAVAGAEAAEARIRGQEDALNAQLALLEKTQEALIEEGGYKAPAGEGEAPGRALQADEARALLILYAERYPIIQQERRKTAREAEDAALAAQRAAKALAKYDQINTPQLVFVPVPAGGQEARAFRYSYAVPAACSMHYRFAAYPDKEEIAIAQDVSIYQESGVAWTGTDLYMSTIRRDASLAPRYVAPWRISLVDKLSAPSFAMKKSEASVARRAAYAPAADMALGIARPEPLDTLEELAVQEERASFRLWKLGKKHVGSGSLVKFALDASSYKARFFYTIRPYDSEKSFLTAELDLAETLELPPGQAQFFVDDALLGARRFSFNDKKGTVFFGTDPQVSSAMRNLKRSEGEEGFFSKGQTLLWHWNISVKNGRSRAVDVLVEDACPVAVDSSVTVTVRSSPKAEEDVKTPEEGGAKVLRWKLRVNPGESVGVDHKVEVKAPVADEKILDTGRPL